MPTPANGKPNSTNSFIIQRSTQIVGGIHSRICGDQSTYGMSLSPCFLEQDHPRMWIINRSTCRRIKIRHMSRGRERLALVSLAHSAHTTSISYQRTFSTSYKISCPFKTMPSSHVCKTTTQKLPSTRIAGKQCRWTQSISRRRRVKHRPRASNRILRTPRIMLFWRGRFWAQRWRSVRALWG